MRRVCNPWSLVLLVSLGGPALAAERGMQVGPMRVLPTLGVSFQRDGNVLRNSQNEVSSFVTVISPGLKVEGGSGASRFVFSYEGDYGRYEESDLPDSDYNDHRVSAMVEVAATDRVRLNAGAHYNRGHDRRGEGAQQGQFLSDELDQFRQTGGDVTLSYGAPGARGMLEFTAGTSDLSYRTNRSYTQFRDRSDRHLGGTFGWRIGGRTTALASVAQREIDFDRTPQGGRNLDSSERDLMVGLNFEATGMLSGRAMFGRTEKDFDDPTIDDFSGFGWMVGMQYAPRTYSVFDLSTQRSAEESDDILTQLAGTSLSVRRMTTLAWTHGWNEQFKTGLDVGIGGISYRSVQDSGQSLRDDDLRAYGVSASYQFREWLSIGASYKSYRRDSDQSSLDYNQDVVLLSFEGTL
ncbi:MAG: outer membrane beta-barrel protein [Xanthomonadales bacterium]|jgi:hypothetical protein|nr:outer membrane beta-barrel protein [Xanthomonadales bacterium]